MATHEELITSLKFEESIRNGLRNYYSYGFKKIKDYDQKKIQTLNNDWERLNSILCNYLAWSSDECGKDSVRFATQDAVSMDENPFHRLYKFCKFNHGDPEQFFNIVIGLSSRFRISGCNEDDLYERLGIDLKLEAKKRPYYRYIEFIKQNDNKNIELRKSDIVYLLIATNNKENKKMTISQLDIDLVEAILEIWKDSRKDIKVTESHKIIEDKLYRSILEKMDIILLNDVIGNICEKYIEFVGKNAKYNIKIIKEKTQYVMKAFEDVDSSGTLSDINYSIEIPKEDIVIVQSLLQIKEMIFSDGPSLSRKEIRILGIEFIKNIFKNYKKIISFLIIHIDDKEIYIKKQEKKNFQLYVDEQNKIVVPRKDEKYVSKLFGYWDFIKNHIDVRISDVSMTETSDKVKKKKKSRKVLVGTNAEGSIETFDIPISNMDDNEMVKKLLDRENGIAQYESTFLANEVSYLEDMFENMKKHIEPNQGLLASQLQCLFHSDVGMFCGNNTAINYILSDLEKLKVLEKTAVSGNCKKIAENVWRLRGATLSELLKEGNDICSNEETDFETNFYRAIDFYSRYFVLGVCGSFIKDRMDRFGLDEQSVFRFKQDYFMNTLNDFKIIDILSVLENDRWCEIKYSHGTAGFSSKILCKPFEIRISSTSGREFLMFYNANKRTCTALRLEFIDDIIAYEEKDVKNALEKNGISWEMVKEDLSNCRESLKSMWGVSFSEKQEENASYPVDGKDVKLTIKFNNKNQYYISNRFRRESRDDTSSTYVDIQKDKGIITFKARISDPMEMRPWIRSFYSRILSVEGLETESFSVLQDVEKCINRIKGIDKSTEEKNTKPKRWEGDVATLGRIENGEKVRTHELLFNEVFGIYYYIIAEIIVQCCSKESRLSMSRRQINNIVRKVENFYQNKGGVKTFRLSFQEISGLINNEAFGKNFVINGEKRTRFKYECNPETEFYRDAFPLTVLEVRWLKSVIKDDRIMCFLNSEQIRFLQRFLDDGYPDVNPLPQEYLVYYDRYIVEQSEKENEKEFLHIVIDAIKNEQLIHLKYKTNSEKFITKSFKPILIEYSKRNNKFQVQLQASNNARYYTVNISQINSCIELKEEFDYVQTLKEYKEFRQKKERSVVVQFYDIRNMVDRILTEFSPWKKNCSYDSQTNIYTLKLYYSQDEELDVVIRLMGYGPNIHFPDKNHSIAREILKRYTKQRDMLLERNKNDERGNR